MIILINLLMLAGIAALLAIPYGIHKIVKNPDYIYVKSVQRLVKLSNKAVTVGDLAARDRYNYALTNLVQSRNPEAETFQTKKDNPLAQYGLDDNGYPPIT